MSIILNQIITTPDTGDNSTVQSIIDKVAQDVRFQLSNSGTDATILIDYTNRIHKDILRRTRWQFLLSPVQTFTTQIGKSDYHIGTDIVPPEIVETNLALSNIGTIKRSSVFDRTNKRPLFPTAERPLMQVFTANGRPRLWRNDSTTPGTLSLYPPPDGAYSIEFRYYCERVTLTQGEDRLQTDSDYDDVVVAGVNMYAYQFIKNDPERAQFWGALYNKLVRDMVRDSQAFPRGPEFIAPDVATQVRGVSWGMQEDYFNDTLQ